MSSVTVSSIPLRTRPSARLGSYFGPRLWMVVIVAMSLLAIRFSSSAERAIVVPAMVMIDAAAIFFLTLYRRDRKLPVFEIGPLWVIVALLYSVYPLLNYYAGGLHWTILSDGRLFAYDYIAPYEIGAFAWLYVAFVVPFIVTYLVVRKRATVARTYTAPVSRARVTAVVLTYIGCSTVLALVGRYYGISYDPSYVDIAADKVTTITALPFVLLQVVHWFLPIRLFLMQILLFVTMRHWRNWKYRVGIICFFIFELVRTVLVGGSRTQLVLLGLTFVLLYHRLVRPLTIKIAMGASVLALLGFNFLGLVRAPGYLDLVRDYNVPRLATANEFQVVWGTSFDIYERKKQGVLGDVPWQLPFSDFYYMVPSQLLPFEKIDPTAWYAAITGYEGGMMFGVVSQAIISLGWKQLVLEGMLLGFICAKLHRWYVKRSDRFWPVAFYLFCCIWTYYSMRQSCFAVLAFIEYEFIPTLILVEFFTVLMRRAHMQARKLMNG